MEYKATILIVDDEPRSLYAIEMLLSQEPYQIVFADRGNAALEQVESENPDVILLDVMMPDITGYEVCKRLKSDERWRHIPIILVTALDRKEDVVQGLESGADEFLTKPVHGPELRARVNSMLRIKKQYDEIQETMQLREDMADMIVHDMRSPISALMLYTELLSKKGATKVSYEELAQKISVQSHRLNSYLGDMLLLAKMRSNKLILNRTPIDARALLLNASNQYRDAAASKDVELELIMPDVSCEISVDRKLMQRVLDNLLSNALKFSPQYGTITLCLEYQNGSDQDRPAALIQVIDQGPGVPEEYHNRIFNKYEVVDLEQTDIPQIGLGLALCQMVVDAHDGRIFVKDNSPTGAVFCIEI
jgi:two-component system sensor histidine kinase/response regulator